MTIALLELMVAFKLQKSKAKGLKAVVQGTDRPSVEVKTVC